MSKLAKIFAVVLVIAVALMTYVFAIEPYLKNIDTDGTVIVIGFDIYSDSECTNLLTVINWNEVHTNQHYVFEAYAKNTGNKPLTLTMTVSSMTPIEASSVLTPSWNNEGLILSPDEVQLIEFYLDVADVADITFQSFQYTMTIFGVE